jgi:hypothetical protein
MMRAARAHLSRRDLLKRAGATGIVVTLGAIVHPVEGWGLEPSGLKPETMRTLVKMARDTYPHDRLPDRIYAVAVKPFDAQAAGDPAAKALIENGVTTLDEIAVAKHGVAYVEVGWEGDRTAVLKEIEDSSFFQKVRSSLVTGIYNNEETWPVFGYEGSSADKGGYIHRGFDDIAWL